jgi:dephospho-CoA kinase
MLVIGLTGGIATGKSTVSDTLKELGATIINADLVGHESYLPGKPAWKDIVATWGEDKVLDPETKNVDRRKLGAIVFGDPDALQTLNRIVWPRIYDMTAEKIEEHRRQGVSVLVLEAAVLIEANWTPLVDEVWVVVTPPEVAVKRLMGRNNLTEEQAFARIRSQISNEERVKRATVVIENAGALGEVKERVRQLWRERAEAGKVR